ncbi:MAG: PA-phosphatase, partial [Chitinophagales bacterium]
HSTFSGAGAEVLGYFFPSAAGEFAAMAVEASESRIYARIHFRYDCETGVEVGNNIGGYSIAAAAADGAD